MIRVFIADVSAVTRSIEKDILKQNSRFQLCGDASSEMDFLGKIETAKADALLIDYNIFSGKRIDSVFYLLSKMKTPIILFVPKEYVNYTAPLGIKTLEKPDFSSCSKNQLVEYASFFENTISNIRKDFHNQEMEIFEQIYTKAQKTENIPNKLNHGYIAVCVGVSTGGPGTIHELLKGIGSDFPIPIFITQHIDSYFDKNLINWLATNITLPVHLAGDNMKPQAGHVYFAPSDYHLTFASLDDGTCILKLNSDEPVNFLRPAVDKMFESAANIFGNKCIGVLLTGMGADGAKGCCKIKEKGGYTIAQDEKTCVVFGMPKAAIDAGGINQILPIEKIAGRLKELVKV